MSDCIDGGYDPPEWERDADAAHLRPMVEANAALLDLAGELNRRRLDGLDLSDAVCRLSYLPPDDPELTEAREKAADYWRDLAARLDQVMSILGGDQ